MTKVSIITVCLNSENTIEKTIKSVLAQTYKDFEYIIVDGCSTDKTLEIVNKYKARIDHIVSEPDNGLYDAMNKGIHISTGQIIGIINSDDWYEKDAVKIAVETFENHEDIGALYGDMNYIEPGKRPYKYEPPEFKTLWRLMAVNHPATFVRRTVYDKCGFFDTSYRNASDVDIMQRFWRNGVKFGHVGIVLSNFRVGGVSCSRRDENDYEVRRMIEQHFEPKLFLNACFGKLIKPDVPLFLWGAGRWGTFLAKFFMKQGIKIEGIYDVDSTLWGDVRHSVRIISPDTAGDFGQQIIIAINKEDIDILEYINRDRLENLKIIYIRECFEEYENELLKKYGSCTEIEDQK